VKEGVYRLCALAFHLGRHASNEPTARSSPLARFRRLPGRAGAH
jgi:hypothetical protein